MKKYYGYTGWGLFLGLLLAALAAPAMAQTKIGFVNTARVLEEAPQADAARKKLEAEFAPRDRELVATQQQLRGLEERLNRDAAIMSESERRNLEREIIAQKRDIARSQEEFREDLNLRRNEELGRLQRRVYEAIVGLANAGGFDIVLGDSVIFASDRIDLTDAVIERLRKEFEAGASQNGAPRRN